MVGQVVKMIMKRMMGKYEICGLMISCCGNFEGLTYDVLYCILLQVVRMRNKANRGQSRTLRHMSDLEKRDRNIEVHPGKLHMVNLSNLYSYALVQSSETAVLMIQLVIIFSETSVTN